MPWLTIILSYLLGSIPTAYIAGHLVKGVDIRQIGDENMGAANAYRELGPKTGIIVGIIDAAKGALAVIIAQAINLSQPATLFSGVAAVVGHNWPVFIGFRGGRGTSTTIGILLALMTKPMLVLAAPTLLFLILKKNVTYACAFMFISLPLVSWWLGVSWLLIGYGIALPSLVGFTHFLRVKRQVTQQT